MCVVDEKVIKKKKTTSILQMCVVDEKVAVLSLGIFLVM